MGAGKVGEGAAYCVDNLLIGLVQKRTVFDADDILAVWRIHTHKSFAPDSLKSKLNLIAISQEFSWSYDIFDGICRCRSYI